MSILSIVYILVMYDANDLNMSRWSSTGAGYLMSLEKWEWAYYVFLVAGWFVAGTWGVGYLLQLLLGSTEYVSCNQFTVNGMYQCLIVCVCIVFTSTNQKYHCKTMKPTSQTSLNSAEIYNSKKSHAAINPFTLALKKQQLGGTIPGYWIFWHVEGFHNLPIKIVIVFCYCYSPRAGRMDLQALYTEKGKRKDYWTYRILNRPVDLSWASPPPTYYRAMFGLWAVSRLQFTLEGSWLRCKRDWGSFSQIKMTQTQVV